MLMYVLFLILGSDIFFNYYIRTFVSSVNTKYWPENQKGRDHLGDLSIGGKIILKLILKNGGVKCGLDSPDQDRVHVFLL
jgi:hypothetical protein